jgi:hypothetical protein
MSRPPAASQSAPNLTIVMYHYVRPLRGRFAALKGLDIDLFAGQLAYLRRHYTPVSMQQVIAAGAGTELPPRPVLLTFDDGYSDHHRFVFPCSPRRESRARFSLLLARCSSGVCST